MCAKSFQLCPTLCDPMDCISAGSSVHGILQARILEWIAMSHPRASSQPRDQSCISYMSCVYFNNFFFQFKKAPLSQMRSHSLVSKQPTMAIVAGDTTSKDNWFGYIYF